MFRVFGVRNVLLANELVDDASISWVAVTGRRWAVLFSLLRR